MTTLFVPSIENHPQRKAAIQTLIRQHVNRAHKNGKCGELAKQQEQPWLVTLPSRSQPRASRTRLKGKHMCDDETKRTKTHWEIQPNPRSGALLLRVASCDTQYPVFVDCITHELLTIMNTQLETMKDRFKLYHQYWLPLAIHDATAFQQIISMFAAYLGELYGHSMGFPISRAISYHSLALESVRNQLLDVRTSTNVSDGIVVTIIGFVCHANLELDFAQSHAHMKALRYIIDARGGLQSLDRKPMLRLLLFYVDIFGALAQDVVPYFPVPVQILERLMPKPTGEVGGVTHQHIHSLLLLDLQHLISAQQKIRISTYLSDLHATASFLNDTHFHTCGLVWQDSTFIQLRTNALTHNLLSWRGTMRATAGQVVNSSLAIEREIVRIPSILYLANVRRRAGLLPIRTAHLVSKLHTILIQLDDATALLGDQQLSPELLTAPGARHLRIWAFALTAIEAQPATKLRVYFLARLAEELLSYLEERPEKLIGSAQDIVCLLQQFIHCGDVFDMTLQDVAGEISTMIMPCHRRSSEIG